MPVTSSRVPPEPYGSGSKKQRLNFVAAQIRRSSWDRLHMFIARKRRYQISVYWHMSAVDLIREFSFVKRRQTQPWPSFPEISQHTSAGVPTICWISFAWWTIRRCCPVASKCSLGNERHIEINAHWLTLLTHAPSTRSVDRWPFFCAAYTVTDEHQARSWQ
jgi:hypothetical protein